MLKPFHYIILLSVLAIAGVGYFAAEKYLLDNDKEVGFRFSISDDNFVDFYKRDVTCVKRQYDTIGTMSLFIEFSSSGHEKFKKFTRDNVGQYLNIIFNKNVMTDPIIINMPIEGNSIPMPAHSEIALSSIPEIIEFYGMDQCD